MSDVAATSRASGHVFIAISLDGFVAREDHALDWLMKQDTAGEDHGYEDFTAGIDGLVMGAGSFRTALGFETWPYAKPVVVMSRSLGSDDIPADLRGRVRLSTDGPAGTLRALAAEGWRRAYVDGGRLVQSFLREGLIADMVVTVVPILLGGGIRLFGPLEGDIDLELLECRAFPSGLARLRYRCAPKAGPALS